MSRVDSLKSGFLYVALGTTVAAGTAFYLSMSVSVGACCGCAVSLVAQAIFQPLKQQYPKLAIGMATLLEGGGGVPLIYFSAKWLKISLDLKTAVILSSSVSLMFLALSIAVYVFYTKLNTDQKPGSHLTPASRVSGKAMAEELSRSSDGTGTGGLGSGQQRLNVSESVHSILPEHGEATGGSAATTILGQSDVANLLARSPTGAGPSLVAMGDGTAGAAMPIIMPRNGDATAKSDAAGSSFASHASFNAASTGSQDSQAASLTSSGTASVPCGSPTSPNLSLHHLDLLQRPLDSPLVPARMPIPPPATRTPESPATSDQMDSSPPPPSAAH